MGEWGEMFIQSLVSLTHSGLEKLEYSVYLIKFHKNKKCYSDNVEMKFGALNKLDKRNMTVLNNLRMTSLEQIEKSLPLFWIRKPGSRYMVHTSYLSTFYLTKNENILNQKILNVALILLLWVKEKILPKNADILKKKCWFQQNQRDPGSIKYIFRN